MAELRTFVFTDLVGSVDLKSEMPGGSDAERDAAFVTQILSPHRDRIETYAVDFGGRVVSTAGDGHFLVFADAASAALWAVEIVRSHEDDPLASDSGTKAQVRISMHLGSPQIDPRDPHNFIGKAVDYAARLNDFSSSGQILVSRAARAILEDAGLNGVSFHSHGRRDLKGIGEVEIHELLFDGRPPQDTRRTPTTEKPREWTVHAETAPYEQIAGLVPEGGVPVSSIAVRQKKLGNYELGDLVGAGGMGDVFKARHSQFGRLRAVKVIKPHLVAAGQHEVVKRFYQEIKAIGGLEHPNIVVAIDSSTPDDETHFLVMEYVDGTSAGDLVDRFGPMSIENACEVARQTALGLDYIAKQGMVHRDIKPSNLMVTTVATPHLITADTPTSPQPQPLIKILDLGLALLVGDDHERLTRLDHRAMGTAMYMSPEQWRTTSVDIRSDIYSLGCTLYHLLSGRPPFFDSELRPEKAHEKGKVPPIRGGKQIPKGLWNVIRKALAKNPDDRYASPAELADKLAQFAVGNTLVDVVEQARRKPQNEPTQQGHSSDTLQAVGNQSDTLLAGRRPGSTITATPHATRWWLWGVSIALCAAVGAGVWFADQAWRRSADSDRYKQQLVASRETASRSHAQLAVRSVNDEIGTRFRTLMNRTEDANIDVEDGKRVDLKQHMARVSANPQNTALWEPIQKWIVAAKAKANAVAPANSWFLVSADGTQVARAKWSDTISNNYAYRDYFHGEGKDYPKGTTGYAPTKDIHLSAVYKSTSSKRLKVAFSVPIWNERARSVAGVLAMSVDLGDFAVLEKGIPSEKDVLLIDLRADEIENEPRKGLILHHSKHLERKPNEAPARISTELLERIEAALASGESVIVDYAEPAGLNSDRYWCAIEPVNVELRGSDDVLDTQWVVMVQEKLP